MTLPVTVSVWFCFQNWRKELEKHREKLLGGNESSSKKKEVSCFQLHTFCVWDWIYHQCCQLNSQS